MAGRLHELGDYKGVGHFEAIDREIGKWLYYIHTKTLCSIL